MFEKEIKFIIDFTLNRINKLGSFFTFEKLAVAEIHPAIILYISAHLDYLIYEDRKKLLQNSAFDYSGSEISRYFTLIGEEIKKNKRLAFEDVKTLVSHAVTFNINYLVKPNWTLSKLIFNESETRNVNEIKMMLNYLYYYDYVKNVFLGYFSRRKVLSLSETEFDMILGKIDHQMFGKRTKDLIDNALVSIGEFFNEGGVYKTKITTQTVEIFLKEKNLMEALFKLRRAIPAEDKRKYDLEEIRKILYSKESVQVEPEEEKDEEVQKENFVPPYEETGPKQVPGKEIVIEEVSEKEIAPKETDAGIKSEEITGSTETKPAGYNRENITESESPDDFLSRYESELKSLEELEAQLSDLGKEENISFEEIEIGDETETVPGKEIEPSEAKKETEADEASSSGEVISGRSEDSETSTEGESEFSDELIIEEEEFNPFDDEEGVNNESGTSAQAEKNNDILGFLTDREIEKIVANVFNEDEEDFVNTMEKISESANYDEATEILKAVFFSYKVSPYSKDAVTLTNAVSNYFYQEG